MNMGPEDRDSEVLTVPDLDAPGAAGGLGDKLCGPSIWV